MDAAYGLGIAVPDVSVGGFVADCQFHDLGTSSLCLVQEYGQALPRHDTDLIRLWQAPDRAGQDHTNRTGKVAEVGHGRIV